MQKSAKLQFEKQYQDGLRIHVRRKLNGRLTLPAARLIGSKGVTLGLNAIDLAHTHEQALAAQDIPFDVGSDLKVRALLSTASKFLLEAMVPFEESHIEDLLKVRTLLSAADDKLDEETKSHRRLIDDSHKIYEQLRELSHQFLLALEEERKEISRELHDQVAQILAGINVRLAGLKKASMIDRDTLDEGIAQTQLLVEQSVEAVLSYARTLRPVMLDDLGLIPSIRSFIKNLPNDNPLNIRFKHGLEAEALDNTKRTVLYRVAQEAITNVLRHANATSLKVRLDNLEDGVLLVVSDNGKSFHLDRVFSSTITKRLGLLGMRERVDMVGGQFAIKSPPGKGTTVRAKIPYDVAKANSKTHKK